MSTATIMAEQILAKLSESVLEIGEVLDEVFTTYPDFDQFVEDHLPLSPHTAERVRAMYLVHRDRNGHTDLPEPWKALWSLPYYCREADATDGS